MFNSVPPLEYTRILSIDFGLKRVGTALSDPLKIIASPYRLLENTPELEFHLKSIIVDENVELVILGDPGDSDSNKTVKQGVVRLKAYIEKLGVKVILWDETYTSVMAAARIKESGLKKKKRQNKGLIDVNSAVILLEEYLRTV